MKVKDIAKALHLSNSTVSKALNGGFDISQETKDLVLDYVKINGYVPRGERLINNTLRRICFIYDNLESVNTSIFPALLLSFSKKALENNFEVVQTPLSKIDNYDEYLKKNNFYGSFIVGLDYKTPILEQIKSTKFPTVLYDAFVHGDKVSTINSENIICLAKIVRKLVNLGHKKIGFFFADKYSFVSNERFAGYIAGLNTNNLEYNPEYVYYGDFSQESGYNAASFFANSGVTAVICTADVNAIGLIKGLQKYNIRVPEDISIVGYDDLEVSKYITPSLTTIRQNLDLISERAFELLSYMLLNRHSQRVVVNADIIMRESVKAIKE